ncbi:syntenin-1-like [Panonychus citri]|uniref:syntenin-1-like n=1 Tax=Panonychus citri TaxID=50023 RepID=UPI002307F229|nr:syntenin-1-like [Panonychus citri]
MSMYPSLEDMKADQMIQAQINTIRYSANSPSPSSTTTVREGGYPTVLPFASPPSAPVYPPTLGATSSPPPPYPVDSRRIGQNELHMYPALVDLHEYMGLSLTSAELALITPSPTNNTVSIRSPRELIPTSSPNSNMVAPLSGDSLGLKRAAVTHGLRQVVLCKDKSGKVGLRVKSHNKGVFIILVNVDSPAALAGLRFGDQILQINDENVAGYSMEKVHDIIKKSPVNGINMVIRDRPFERTITLHKDSTGHTGFAFKEGKITHIIKDSSAARNGLLIDHQLLEVNGQNVIGLTDKAIRQIMESSENVITITIMPSVIFDHMVKSMASGLIKKLMDHSIPDF